MKRTDTARLFSPRPSQRPGPRPSPRPSPSPSLSLFLSLFLSLPLFLSLTLPAQAQPQAPADAPSPARLLTLDEALSRAADTHPALRASRSTVDAAGHKVLSARAGFLPRADVSLGYRRSTLNSAVAPYMASSPLASYMGREEMTSYDNLSAGLTVTQTIWDFGRTLGSYDAARADVRAKTADLAATTDQIRLAVIQAYMGVLASEEVVRVADETRRQMQEHVAQARSLVAAGTRSAIDVTRAETDLANAEMNVIRARNGLRMARVGLEGAMGVSIGDFRVERPVTGVDPDVGDVEAAVKEAQESRPEVLSLREKLAVLEGAATIARSAWYPSIGASGSLAFTGYKPQDLVYNWGVGVSLTWNAFAGLGTVHSIGEADAGIAAMRATLDNLLLGIRTEVEGAIVAWLDAREKLGPARAVERSAGETLALAEGRYAAGSGSIIEVSDAQALVVAARAGVIQAGYDADTARAKLLKALGRLGGGTRGE